MDFNQPGELGRTGLSVGPLGLGGGYGAPAAAFEEAFERGCNYFYWCSRKSGMAGAIRNLCAAGQREKLVIAVQSYSRSAAYMESSLRKALRQLGIDRADVFTIGWHNRAPARRLVDKAMDLRERCLVGRVGMTGHNRLLFPQMAATGNFDLFHIRYNAAHRGAETEAFPSLTDLGVVTYTATRWGHLLDPKRMPPGLEPPSAADCYRFVMSNPAVDVCLTGPKNIDHMRQALAALDQGPMSEDELERMRTIGDHVHKRKSFF